MIYYCPACHYIYPATSARDEAFCPDCGMATPRPATEEEQAQYKPIGSPLPSIFGKNESVFTGAGISGSRYFLPTASSPGSQAYMALFENA